MSRPFGVALLIAGDCLKRFNFSRAAVFGADCTRARLPPAPFSPPLLTPTPPPSPPGVDEHGPRLYPPPPPSQPLKYQPPFSINLHRFRYQTDPSGTFSRYDAKAIGSGSEGAQTNLQDQYARASFPQCFFVTI